jgi:hypothetical protein
MTTSLFVTLVVLKLFALITWGWMDIITLTILVSLVWFIITTLLKLFMNEYL